MEETLLKYPRTLHLMGSKKQKGDKGAPRPIESIFGRYVVIEEKIDGANSGISFDENGELLLQCRGHFLTGGNGERHFNLFKTWANRHLDALFDIIQETHVMYGEWMYARHSVFYDQLPHYFLEFDIREKKTGEYLSTAARKKRIGSGPIVSVPILWEGILTKDLDIQSLIKPSLYKSPNWRDTFVKIAEQRNINPDKAMSEGDTSDLAEGLYIKVEEDGETVERYKFVRADFTQTIIESGSHWKDRPILPNQLAQGIEIL